MSVGDKTADRGDVLAPLYVTNDGVTSANNTRWIIIVCNPFMPHAIPLCLYHAYGHPLPVGHVDRGWYSVFGMVEFSRLDPALDEHQDCWPGIRAYFGISQGADGLPMSGPTPIGVRIIPVWPGIGLPDSVATNCGSDNVRLVK